MQKRIEIPRMARDFGVQVGAHSGILLLLGMIIMTFSIISMVIFACSIKSSKKRDCKDGGARQVMTEKVEVRVETKTKEAKMSQKNHVPKLPIYVPALVPDHSRKHHHHHRDNSHHHHHHHHHASSTHNHHHHIASIHHHVPMHVHPPTVVHHMRI